MNTGQKRAGSNGHANGSVNKIQKVLEESDIKAMKAFAQAKKIESLNVDKLKDFLRAAGLSVTGKKKAELVVDVYKYCEWNKTVFLYDSMSTLVIYIITQVVNTCNF